MDTVGCACCHADMQFDLETRASPDQVRRALTDFTDRRLQIWHGTLDPKTYELRDQGEHWALARESSPRSPVWVVPLYVWSDPEVVRWTFTDSSYGGGGEGFVRIAPRDGGGSRLHAEWFTAGARRQKPVLLLVHHGPLGVLIARRWASALDHFAIEDEG